MELLDLDNTLSIKGTVEDKVARSILQANSRDGSFFRTAAVEGYLNAVEFFVEAKDSFDLTAEEQDMCVNEGVADREGNTPLHLAALKGHVAVVEYLLSNGACVNVRNQKKETPLHLAAVGDCKDVVELLLSYNADFVTSEDGYFPVDHAIRHGCLDTFRVFLDAALISDMSLDVAAEIGNEYMLRLLLQNTYGFDRTHLLCIAALNGHLGVCKFLLEENNICLQDEDGQTPLHCAADNGHLDIVKLLLSRGAEEDVEDSNGVFPVEYAVMGGHVDVVRFLLSKDAPAGACARYEEVRDPSFLLRYAAYAGHLPMARFLVEEGAEVNRYLSFHLAVLKGQRDTALFLRSLGSMLDTSDMLSQSVESGRLLAAMSCVALGADVHKCWGIDYDNDTDTDSDTSTGTETTLLNIASKNCFFDIARFLLQKGANPNAADSRGMLPLRLACQEGHVNVAKILYAYGASVNAFDLRGCHKDIALFLRSCGAVLYTSGMLAECVQNGRLLAAMSCVAMGADVHKCQNIDKDTDKNSGTNTRTDTTPLNIAIKNGSADIVIFLLQKGANLNAPNTEGLMPLHLACRKGHASIVNMLVAHGASVQAFDENGRTPLHWAKCFTGFELLLEMGADPNVARGDGRTVLHKACCIELLLEMGADPNVARGDGRTVLHKACCIEHIRVLLKNNVLIDARDIHGDTALFRCCSQGLADIVELLIEHGASVNTKNKQGFTPVYEAIIWDRLNVVRVLLKNNVDLTVANGEGKTILHVACYYGRSECCRVLLDANVNVNVRDKSGNTALHDATEKQMTLFFSPKNGKREISEALIKKGAQVNAANVLGQTPLHNAVKWAGAEFIQLLLNNGADPLRRDKEGVTPLQLALERREQNILDAILEQCVSMQMENVLIGNR